MIALKKAQLFGVPQYDKNVLRSIKDGIAI